MPCGRNILSVECIPFHHPGLSFTIRDSNRTANIKEKQVFGKVGLQMRVIARSSNDAAI